GRPVFCVPCTYPATVRPSPSLLSYSLLPAFFFLLPHSPALSAVPVFLLHGRSDRRIPDVLRCSPFPLSAVQPGSGLPALRPAPFSFFSVPPAADPALSLTDQPGGGDAKIRRRGRAVPPEDLWPTGRPVPPEKHDTLLRNPV